MTIYHSRIQQIKNCFEGVNSFDSAQKELDKLQIDRKFLKTYSEHLFETLQTADALGRGLIVEKDRVLSEQANTVAANLSFGNWYVCDDKIVKLTFDIIPKEALKYLEYKSLVIAGVEHDELLTAVKGQLQNATKKGVKFDDWKKEIDSIFDTYGVTQISQHHAETVFHTNIQSGFAVAQLEQVSEMSEQFPMWQFVAIHDDRSRHINLEGIYLVGEGPVPPVDYNCRCTAIYLHHTQVEGLKPVKWIGDKEAVRFNTQKSFDEWMKSKTISSEVQNWIDKNS